MMAALSKTMLLGHVGRKPETKMTPSGQKVSEFSLAVTEKYTDRSGVRQEKTIWHQIRCWRKTADVVEKFVDKGSPLFIEGKLKYDKWEDKGTGKKMEKAFIEAFSVQMLGGRSDGFNQDNGQQGFNQGGGDTSFNQDEFGGDPNDPLSF